MIGILGGTFDPVHFGHLRTALEVMQGVGLEEVRFIPLFQAVHRDQPEVSPRLRLKMVQIAIQGQQGFVADDREMQRTGDSYSVDTLRELRQAWPDKPLCLLLGMDAFSGFPEWRRPDEILRLAHLIVMQRPGQGEGDPTDPRVRGMVEAHRCMRRSQLKERGAGCIFFQPVTQLQISASHIRAMVATGQSPRYLLPEPVLRVIEENRLYQSERSTPFDGA
ncbi:MAG: nicotinate-nucleotide adenylyltransferase [Candidatus Thiodiazotropha sp. (ex Epidulcina cf. delphinae)]|nr:nicotinate-nucleotide adenylyltransferase [Candidatus Thiodiazotropha sp. (ex Epidulcina cf. delphinae)]